MSFLNTPERINTKQLKENILHLLLTGIYDKDNTNPDVFNYMGFGNIFLNLKPYDSSYPNTTIDEYEDPDVQQQWLDRQPIVEIYFDKENPKLYMECKYDDDCNLVIKYNGECTTHEYTEDDEICFKPIYDIITKMITL